MLKKYHPSKVKSVLYQNTDNHLGELWQRTMLVILSFILFS